MLLSYFTYTVCKGIATRRIFNGFLGLILAVWLILSLYNGSNESLIWEAFDIFLLWSTGVMFFFAHSTRNDGEMEFSHFKFSTFCIVLCLLTRLLFPADAPFSWEIGYVVLGISVVAHLLYIVLFVKR